MISISSGGVFKSSTSPRLPTSSSRNITLHTLTLNNAVDLELPSVAMAGSKKINKAKAREPKTKDVIVVNNYAVIADMDGNPNSPQEFDESHHDEGELYFKADEDATEVRTLTFSC